VAPYSHMLLKQPWEEDVFDISDYYVRRI